jgi:hypothetical protein
VGVGFVNKAVRHDRWICRSLRVTFRSGLPRRSDHAGMGMGAMDQAEAKNLEDQFDFVVRWIPPGNSIGALCTLDDLFRSMCWIRNGGAELRTCLRFLLQVPTMGHASLRFGYSFRSLRSVAIELASLARPDMFYRKPGILAARDNMGVTDDSGRAVCYEASVYADIATRAARPAGT